jgi:DNA-binding transcriptional ArsR family regulator
VDVFDALADANRRDLVVRLAGRENATATELSAELPLTRQGVAKHLAALREAGLVEPQRSGRETRYRLTPAPLGDAVAWMASVGARWDNRLAALGDVYGAPIQRTRASPAAAPQTTGRTVER